MAFFSADQKGTIARAVENIPGEEILKEKVRRWVSAEELEVWTPTAQGIGRGARQEEERPVPTDAMLPSPLPVKTLDFDTPRLKPTDCPSQHPPAQETVTYFFEGARDRQRGFAREPKRPRQLRKNNAKRRGTPSSAKSNTGRMGGVSDSDSDPDSVSGSGGIQLWSTGRMRFIRQDNQPESGGEEGVDLEGDGPPKKVGKYENEQEAGMEETEKNTQTGRERESNVEESSGERASEGSERWLDYSGEGMPMVNPDDPEDGYLIWP